VTKLASWYYELRCAHFSCWAGWLASRDLISQLVYAVISSNRRHILSLQLSYIEFFWVEEPTNIPFWMDGGWTGFDFH
jgi:hypothetical protein